MNDAGYLKEDMLPLSNEKAVELMARDITVYALRPDNTEEMLFDISEIEDSDSSMFGIAKENWEEIKDTVRPRDFEKTSKPPTVAELKEQAMSGKPISLLDLAEAAHREQKPKSILAQLKQPPVKKDKPKAPKKSAEMEI